MRTRLGILAAVLSVGLVWPNVAKAAIITPASLEPGDVFRLVFVTSATRDATSNDILTYDAFVYFSALGAGITTYYGQNVNWYALASTPTVDADDRLSGSTIPIYELDGTLVASGNRLWSGEFLFSEINTNEFGNKSTTAVWTGTDRFGDAVPNLQLGSGTGSSAFGLTTENLQFPGLWTYTGFSGSSDQRSLYAFSSLLVVPQSTLPPEPELPTPVPEPATLVLLGSGLLGALGRGRFRRKQQD